MMPDFECFIPGCMRDFNEYNLHLARLVSETGSKQFSARLVAALRGLVTIDDATVVVYPEREFPVIDYFEVPDDNGASTLDRFVNGAFVLDPYYIAGTDEQFGLFRLRDLSPAGFRDSEYYKNWYRNCGYKDECGYVIRLSDEGFVNIALGKTRPHTSFNAQEVSTLQGALPLIEALCRQHWQAGIEAAPGSVDLRRKVHEALRSFGESLLTEREAQVIHLVLHGHSTKTVAEKLSISIETVKLHRKHAYAKLEVSSQAELFYLFLDSLMSAKDYQGGDTLVAYMQPPR